MRKTSMVGRVIERLKSQGTKSQNGGEYNYHKVYQILNGRYKDNRVMIARAEILLEDKAEEVRLKELEEELVGCGE